MYSWNQYYIHRDAGAHLDENFPGPLVGRREEIWVSAYYPDPWIIPTVNGTDPVPLELFCPKRYSRDKRSRIFWSTTIRHLVRSNTDYLTHLPNLPLKRLDNCLSNITLPVFKINVNALNKYLVCNGNYIEFE